MSKKHELLVTAANVKEAEVLLQAGADALVIGDDRFGMRLPGSFSVEETAEVVAIAAKHQARVYVSMTNLMSNELLKELPEYVQALGRIGIDGVEFNDPSVLATMKEYAPHVKLHWNAEMTSTNYATANYWGTKGASRVVLARVEYGRVDGNGSFSESGSSGSGAWHDEYLSFQAQSGTKLHGSSRAAG